jgi:hypothetical protein
MAPYTQPSGGKANQIRKRRNERPSLKQFYVQPPPAAAHATAAAAHGQPHAALDIPDNPHCSVSSPAFSATFRPVTFQQRGISAQPPAPLSAPAAHTNAASPPTPCPDHTRCRHASKPSRQHLMPSMPRIQNGNTVLAQAHALPEWPRLKKPTPNPTNLAALQPPCLSRLFFHPPLVGSSLHQLFTKKIGGEPSLSLGFAIATPPPRSPGGFGEQHAKAEVHPPAHIDIIEQSTSFRPRTNVRPHLQGGREGRGGRRPSQPVAGALQRTGHCRITRRELCSGQCRRTRHWPRVLTTRRACAGCGRRRVKPVAGMTRAVSLYPAGRTPKVGLLSAQRPRFSSLRLPPP